MTSRFHPRTLPLLPVAALLLAALAPAAPSRGGADVVETRALHESIPVDRPGDVLVVVENVVGSVRVSTHDRPAVEMTATETIRARDRDAAERARREVGLRVERDDGRIAFVVRGDDAACDCRRDRWDGFVVEYEIEVRVPAAVSIDVATVNDGAIEVRGVHGAFAAANVNGPVHLVGLATGGRASTVNGEIRASFSRAPGGPTDFETVNGDITVRYPSDLSADLTFRTMHGDIWTDFEAAALELDPLRERTGDDGLTIVRTESRSGIRVARGGPTHSFETLNGDILIEKTDTRGAWRTER